MTLGLAVFGYHRLQPLALPLTPPLAGPVAPPLLQPAVPPMALTPGKALTLALPLAPTPGKGRNHDRLVELQRDAYWGQLR